MAAFLVSFVLLAAAGIPESDGPLLGCAKELVTLRSRGAFEVRPAGRAVASVVSLASTACVGDSVRSTTDTVFVAYGDGSLIAISPSGVVAALAPGSPDTVAARVRARSRVAREASLQIVAVERGGGRLAWPQSGVTCARDGFLLLWARHTPPSVVSLTASAARATGDPVPLLSRFVDAGPGLVDTLSLAGCWKNANALGARSIRIVLSEVTGAAGGRNARSRRPAPRRTPRCGPISPWSSPPIPSHAASFAGSPSRPMPSGALPRAQFERAAKLAPQDSRVLTCLAFTCSRMGDRSCEEDAARRVDDPGRLFWRSAAGSDRTREH